eukprot:1544698-Pyramimonas_sp.AAC.1
MYVSSRAGDGCFEHVGGDLVKSWCFSSFEIGNETNSTWECTNMLNCVGGGHWWLGAIILSLNLLVSSDGCVFLLCKVACEQIILFKVGGNDLSLSVRVVWHGLGVVSFFTKCRAMPKSGFGVLPGSAMLVYVSVVLELCGELFDVGGSVAAESSGE